MPPKIEHMDGSGTVSPKTDDIPRLQRGNPLDVHGLFHADPYSTDVH